MIGETIDDRYRVLRILGQGGMGAVYEAEHTGTRRRVAVKVILGGELAQNPTMVQRFEREAKAAGSIDTKHIVQVFDTGVDRKTGTPFMVMELLKGEDLQNLLRRVGCLSPDTALRIVGQACIGLLKAHEAGVVHRDIKPANLFLAEGEGDEIVVKVVDFGVAKMKTDVSGSEEVALTRTGSLLGSPLYMSPEQAVGKKSLDHRTDVWSLGAVLYQTLLGRVAHWECETLGALIIAICAEPAAPLQEHAPWLSEEIAYLVHRALSIDVKMRWQSMGEMLDAIHRVIPGDLGVRASMLVPLSDQERAHVALRHTLAGLGNEGAGGASGGPAAAVRANGLPATLAEGQTGIVAGSAAGLSLSQTRQPARSSVVPLVAAAVLLAAGGVGTAAYLLRDRGDRAGVEAENRGTPQAVAPPPAPVVVASAAESRTVRVAIDPANAGVEIDGRDVPVKDGAVELSGLVGSVHRVRVKLNGRETAGDVAVSLSGAVPDKMQLGAAPKSLGKPTAGPAASGPAPVPAPPPKPSSDMIRRFE